MKTDDEMIAEAIAAGRVRRFPRGAHSDWDELSYRARRQRMLESIKGNNKNVDFNLKKM